MKLNKQILTKIIREALQEEGPPRLKTQAMGASQFARAGRETRETGGAELSSQEKGIVQQIDEFLLRLANMEDVDLNAHRPMLERLLKQLQDKIGSSEDLPTGEKV